MTNTAKKFLRTALILTLLLAMMLPLAGCGTSKPTLTVYNWEDYIGEGVIDKFKEEYGVNVNYVRFTTNEEMYTKIKAGGTNYDVAFPSDYMIERMINEDMLETIDVSQLENFKYIRPDLISLEYDPNNEYSVPYMWGTVGIMYNTTKVDEPITSWKSLWDPKYSGEIFMMDSIRDSIGITLKMLNYSLNTREAAHLEAAKQALIEQRPLVKAYGIDDTKDKMARGEGALAVMWSGDAVIAQENNEDLAYVVPEEGSNIWFDGMVVLKGSKNKDLAMKFIDFMCRPDIAFENTDYIGYSSPNTEAIKMLPAEIQQDPAHYPDTQTMENLEIFKDLGTFTAEYERIWNEVKTAQ